jgi:hypothetical protein
MFRVVSCRLINTSTKSEVNIMDTIEELANDVADARRKAIRPVLDQIAAELAGALRDAGLDFPVYLSIPTSGRSIISFVTPGDPTEAQWSQATELLCATLSERLDRVKLMHRELTCAVANSTPVAAEITATAD